MKFLTFIENGAHQLGLSIDETRIVNVTAAWESDLHLPSPTCIDDLLPMRAAGLEAINALSRHPDTKHVRYLTEITFAPPLVPAPKGTIKRMGLSG